VLIPGLVDVRRRRLRGKQSVELALGSAAKNNSMRVAGALSRGRTMQRGIARHRRLQAIHHRKEHLFHGLVAEHVFNTHAAGIHKIPRRSNTALKGLLLRIAQVLLHLRSGRDHRHLGREGMDVGYRDVQKERSRRVDWNGCALRNQTGAIAFPRPGGAGQLSHRGVAIGSKHRVRKAICGTLGA